MSAVTAPQINILTKESLTKITWDFMTVAIQGIFHFHQWMIILNLWKICSKDKIILKKRPSSKYLQVQQCIVHDLLQGKMGRSWSKSVNLSPEFYFTLAAIPHYWTIKTINKSPPNFKSIYFIDPNYKVHARLISPMSYKTKIWFQSWHINFAGPQRDVIWC